MTDVLLAPHRLSRDGTGRQSVIVVGLPRSGSSLLSQVMSELPGWYVFDDLYTSRAAKQAGVFDKPFGKAALEDLLYFLGWQIRARKRHGLYAIPAVEEHEIEPMNAALLELFEDTGADWIDLEEEWLVRLAARRGCPNWGYKAPGAFRYLDRMLARHPNMKAVFLMRAPEAVLASYKYMPKTSQDGDPAQYHPVSHALYWRAAARAWRRAVATHGEDRIQLVRFEDMVVDPADTITRLATFLGTPVPDNPVLPGQKNTSFPSGTRRALTRLERGIVGAIAGKARADLGFGDPPDLPAFEGRDLVDFLRTGFRATRYRLGQGAATLRHRLARRSP